MATLDQSNTATVTGGNGIRYQASDGNFLAGIQFVPTRTQKIVEAHLTLGKMSGGTPTGNMWVEIYSDNGSNVPNTQTGADSATVACNTVTGVYNVAPQEITFTWSTGIDLTSGTKYWLVFNADYTYSGTNDIVICTNGTAYQSTMRLKQNSSWTDSGAYGWFKEYDDYSSGGFFAFF